MLYNIQKNRVNKSLILRDHFKFHNVRINCCNCIFIEMESLKYVGRHIDYPLKRNNHTKSVTKILRYFFIFLKI